MNTQCTHTHLHRAERKEEEKIEGNKLTVVRLQAMIVREQWQVLT